MFHSIMADFVNYFSNLPGNISRNGIPSPEEFSRILERERERSDRSGQEFSLVVFNYGRHDSKTDDVKTLLKCIISRRIRAIDEVGWFKEGSVATLLACTSKEGACNFVNDVLSGIPSGITLPVCKVYTYPSTWFSNGIGDRNGRERNQGKDEYVQEGFWEEKCSPLNGNFEHSRIVTDYFDKCMGYPLPLWKRCLDIVGALVGLILFAPLILLIAAFIKMVSPGPAFYRQERVGHMGKRFTLWKFRTMHLKNDASEHKEYLKDLIGGNAPMVKLDDGRDPRIISCGKVLRNTYLDEIPQLFNVLLGDMSLVGPRPCLPYEAEEYLQWHARRFDTVPGMTGLWQVSGKNRLSFKEMVRLDIRYSRAMSLWLDVKILLLTGPAILGLVSNSLAKPGEIEQESTVFHLSKQR